MFVHWGLQTHTHTNFVKPSKFVKAVWRGASSLYCWNRSLSVIALQATYNLHTVQCKGKAMQRPSLRGSEIAKPFLSSPTVRWYTEHWEQQQVTNDRH
jgi:hypothetical protein